MKPGILFVEGIHGFINQAIVDNLTAAGFDVIRVEEELIEIMEHREDANIILYYPGDEADRIDPIMRHLTEVCRDDHKSMCLVGEHYRVDEAKKTPHSDRINACFVRPIDINRLVNEIRVLAKVRQEFDRTKSILVVDDDADYLNIISLWLRPTYKVDTVRTGVEALFYLNVKKPDLVLLDYDMPELNGYQVMDAIRNRPQTINLPIIFLTGKNDRDTVMRILEKRPTGYLLKAMRREELLDTLTRYFDDSIIMQRNHLKL